MKKLLVATVALAALGLSHVQAADDEGLKPGTPAPLFKVADLAGQEFDLKQAKGRVVFLDFWATWCPPCCAALPHTNEIAARKEVKDGKLLVLALDQDETKDKVAGFLANHKYGFRCAIDKSGAIAKPYKVDGIPTFVVIGRDGKVAWYGCGYEGEATGKAIDKAIAEALAKK